MADISNMFSIGAIRGEWMKEKRREAFIKKFEREPNWNMEYDPETKKPTDFMMARKLVDEDALYKEFDTVVIEEFQRQLFRLIRGV